MSPAARFHEKKKGLKKMCVCFCARLFAWLYGFAWPLGHAPSRALAITSAISFPIEVYNIIMLVCQNMKRGGK